METIVEYMLGDEGRTYIREHLSGVNTFCTALLQTFIHEPGEIFTLAPVEISPARLIDFECGGLLSYGSVNSYSVMLPDGSRMSPIPSLKIEQAFILRRETLRSLSGACILDDTNPEWGEKYFRPEPTAFGLRKEVYQLLTAEHSDENFLDAIRRTNTLWHNTAAVCATPPKLNKSRETTEEIIKECAATAALITCTAYDGEGFVAWRRTKN
ncbi:MAG: hypothetical protein R3C60_05565 [Parvularculaceae bacterium]